MASVVRSIRFLHKHWKLTAVAVFSLSIAMVLGVVSLSIANTFALLAPAAADPDRLAMIYAHWPDEAIGEFSYPDYKYLRENNHVFTDIAASPHSIGIHTNWEGPHEVNLIETSVSDNYFAVLGIWPYLGSLFSPGDDNAKTKIAVMTYALWKRLGADLNIAGKTISGYRIIGVTPREFTGSFFGVNGDLFTPLLDPQDSSSWFTQRDARRLILIARLRPGVTKRQAQAELTTLSQQMALAYPKEDKDLRATVTRATLLPPDTIPAAEWILAILLALVVLVLLIACANVANLLLAVAVGRRQEAAIKLALGASRRRVIREFLRESAIICAISAVVGYFIAATLIARYSDIAIDVPGVGSFSFGLNLRLDATVGAFTAGLMLIAIVATGLGPAFYASSPNLAQIMSGEVVVGGTRRSARRNAFVIAQVAACSFVLIGMGLCQRSLYNLRHSDVGFSARNLVGAMLHQPQGTSEAQWKQVYENLRGAVSAVPGVESVALARDVPLWLGFQQTPAQIPDSDKKIFARDNIVDADYFSTLGIRTLAGRVFNSGDRENTQDVVVINQKMAETFWPGQEAVGQFLLTGDPLRKAIVIGVTADSKNGNLDETPGPAVYYALSQHYQEKISIIARTGGDPILWVEPIDQTIRALGLVHISRPITFNEWINFNLLTQRITAGCVAALSALGMLLAILGLFGAISYSVSERKKEFGIRVALGARRRELMKMILRQTFWITGAGIALGMSLGVVATILLRSQFYGISPVELTVLLPVSAAMEAVSLLVAYMSARPWITIDPMEAVRHA